MKGRGFMKASRLLSAVIILTAASGRADDAANKVELEKLHGRWKLISVLDRGKDDDRLTKRGGVFAFEKDSVTLSGEANNTTEKYRIRLDSSTNPKPLDFVKSSKDGHERVVEGVYMLDGDTLTWCFNLDGERPAKAKRPAAVESKADSSAVLFKLKRIRE